MNESIFTLEQWALIAEAPLLAGLAVTAMDFGVVSAVKESAAVIRTIQAAAERAPESLLLERLRAPLSISN